MSSTKNQTGKNKSYSTLLREMFSSVRNDFLSVKNQIFAKNKKFEDINFAKNNIKKANILLLCYIIFLLICNIAEAVGALFVFRFESTALIVYFINPILLVLPVICWFITKGSFKYMKIWLFSVIYINAFFMSLLVPHYCIFLFIPPIILSGRYYSIKTTLIVSIVSILCLFSSGILWYLIGYSVLLNQDNLNPLIVEFISDLLGINNIMTFVSVYQLDSQISYCISCCVLLAIISGFIILVLSVGLELSDEKERFKRDKENIEVELNLAHDIQINALPILWKQREHKSYDVDAVMDPAKEVGGDFFDVVKVDKTHLALVIADVSGKGVPAAMYMMISSVLIDSCLKMSPSPGEILTEVNHRLCNKGIDDMFVTIWLGIIDLKTGIMRTSNAGHEYPIIARKGENYQIIKDKHGLVAGFLDGIRYYDEEYKLSPGDRLFVYTDGIPEAFNSKKEPYGFDRLCAVLNKNKYSDMKTLSKNVRQDINSFVDKADQFDDITMITFRLNSYESSNSVTFLITKDTVLNVENFIYEQIIKGSSKGEKDPRIKSEKSRIGVVIDEICSNIIFYSKATSLTVECEVDDKTISFKFADNGIPFNPLENEFDEGSLGCNAKKIGGLGIFITKKLMSEFKYTKDNNINEVAMLYNRKKLEC